MTYVEPAIPKPASTGCPDESSCALKTIDPIDASVTTTRAGVKDRGYRDATLNIAPAVLTTVASAVNEITRIRSRGGWAAKAPSAPSAHVP